MTGPWSISIPHRTRDESLIDVASHARRLDGDDRAVTRQIALDAVIAGMSTTGELLDHVEQLAPAERRALLDQAREACGLPSIADVEQRQHVATLIHRTHQGPPLQRCAIPDCASVPTNGIGAIVEVDVRRWHCPAHEHLAAADDMEPHGSGLRLAPSGVLIPDLPDDERRDAIAAESERRLREAQAADRAVDADELRAHQRALAERLDAELPPHLRGVV